MADIVYNYVKFMRGTPTAFKNLASKNKDTLYFIHEEDAITGQLYIGDILISDNLENDSDVIVAKLSDLEDVNITGVVDKQVLGYDADTGKWIPVTLEQAINVAPMIGATADTDGAEGLVPAPKAGDEGKFLRGDGTWVAIPELNGLKYKKVNSKDEIDITAEDAENYIYLVPVEDGTHEEYIIIDGSLEMLGSLTAALENYVKTEDLETTNTEVESLKTSLGTIDTKVINMEFLLNNKVNQEEYNTKIVSIENDIASLKQSSTWGTL